VILLRVFDSKNFRIFKILFYFSTSQNKIKTPIVVSKEIKAKVPNAPPTLKEMTFVDVNTTK
jgi:hypothetical protein